MYEDVTVSLVDTGDAKRDGYFFTAAGAMVAVNALVADGIEFTITQVPFDTFLKMILPIAGETRKLLKKARKYPLRDIMLDMNDEDLTEAFACILCAKEMAKYGETP